MEMLKLFGGFAIAGLFLIVVYNVIMKVVRGAADLLSQDVETTRVNMRWNYYYRNSHDELIANGGYLTETGALRAAQKRRNEDARQLGNTCGLL